MDYTLFLILCNVELLIIGSLPIGSPPVGFNWQYSLWTKHNELRSEISMGNINNQPFSTNMEHILYDSNLETIPLNHALQCNYTHNTQLNKQIKQIELLNENIIQIKNIIPTIGNDFSIEKMKSKLLEKDIMINKLENKIKIYDENNNIIEYIKNNMITKNNLKTIRDRNKMYAMLMFLNGIAFGYIVGIKLRKNRKLLFHSTAGLSGISFLGFNQWDHKYWGKLLSVSTGFLIGFSVASKM
eukprot:232502_1